jgi:hypothetical protein
MPRPDVALKGMHYMQCNASLTLKLLILMIQILCEFFNLRVLLDLQHGAVYLAGSRM